MHIILSVIRGSVVFLASLHACQQAPFFLLTVSDMTIFRKATQNEAESHERKTMFFYRATEAADLDEY